MVKSRWDIAFKDPPLEAAFLAAQNDGQNDGTLQTNLTGVIETIQFSIHLGRSPQVTYSLYLPVASRRDSSGIYTDWSRMATGTVASRTPDNQSALLHPD